MEENIVPTEGQTESGEARGAEEQALEDATHEPRTFVEGSRDYQQAEDIQENLVSVTENAARAAEDIGCNPIPLPLPADEEISSNPIPLPSPEDGIHTDDITEGNAGKTFKDPLTGKGYGGEDDSSDSSSGEGEPLMVEGSEPGIDAQAPADGFTASQKMDAEPGMASPEVIDGVEKVYRMGEQNVDPGQKAGAGVEGQGGASKDFDPQRLGPENLPQEKQIPVGMGPKGALFPGKIPGGKGPGGGSSSSGGGPPVNVPGGGKGKEPGAPKGVDQKAWGQNQRRLDVEGMKQGSKTTITDKETGITWTLGKDGIWRRQEVDDETAPAENPKEGDPIDGDFGMPYTGSGGGGEKPNPDEPQGGLDRESGKVFPVVPKGGGGGDSGGKTPGDKDGEDDSGKFLGDPDLTGGPDLGDPDFPDYYTPNVLDEAEKSKRAGKGK